MSRDITRYSDYFNIEIPESGPLLVMLICIGAFAGIISIVMMHYSPVAFYRLVLLGAGVGVLIVSLPALLTAIVVKGMQPRLKMKHALFAAMAASIVYSLFIFADALIYLALHNATVTYVLLILANAGIYGYWFFINKFAVGQRKSAIVTSSVQPVLNILLYLPLGKYVLGLGVPFDAVIVKLYAGMIVFMLIGYLMLYLLDRPAKKKLEASSVALMSGMIGQWLYDFTGDTKILGTGGIKRDVDVDILTLKGKKGDKAAFIRPDVHYGPFGGIGGTVLPEYIGNRIISKYKACPFVLHGAVNIDDNPISTGQSARISGRVSDYLERLNGGSFRAATGGVSIGRKGPCRAISIRIGDAKLLVLSKAPTVTEDIDREIGMYFKELASSDGTNVIVIDAHNSRFETAGADELRGIHKGSKYIPMYVEAIRQTLKDRKNAGVSFGCSSKKLAGLIKSKEDMGNAYTSVGIFGYGRRRLALVYFDANNILPGFRSAVLEHIKERFGIDAEVCSTDTHSVNSLALTASNALGRRTNPKDIMPIIDIMIEEALVNMEPVSYNYGTVTLNGFNVWGPGSEELIMKVGEEVVNIGKHTLPFLIVAGFIIAAWIIYIV